MVGQMKLTDKLNKHRSLPIKGFINFKSSIELKNCESNFLHLSFIAYCQFCSMSTGYLVQVSHTTHRDLFNRDLKSSN